MTNQTSPAPPSNEEIEALARKIAWEGVPKEETGGDDKIHPFLPDDEVLPVQESLWLRYPILAKYEAQFATAEVEPPYTGTLPTGDQGTTQWPVLMFLITSKHPRPVQSKYGYPHVSQAIVWKDAWEIAEAEKDRYVDGSDPTRKIFEALAAKHIDDLLNYEAMMD